MGACITFGGCSGRLDLTSKLAKGNWEQALGGTGHVTTIVSHCFVVSSSKNSCARRDPRLCIPTGQSLTGPAPGRLRWSGVPEVQLNPCLGIGVMGVVPSALKAGSSMRVEGQMKCK